MIMRRIPPLIALVTVAAFGLVACGSGGDETSAENVDRQASLSVLSAEICVSRESSAGPMTVTFRNSIRPGGNGPFNLDYIQCGEHSEARGRSANPILRLDIADATGTNVLYMSAQNPEIGYPAVRVASWPDGEIDQTYEFAVGETFTYDMGEYSVRVERQPDTDTAKSFRAWVSRP